MAKKKSKETVSPALKVEIKCSNKETAPLKSLTNLQGNLKELPSENYKKLREDLLRFGFIEPISIWTDPKRKKYILNGHQRVKALNLMADEGIIVPEDIPVNSIQAKNITEARQKLLALASQYGVFTADGFKDFVKDIDLTPTEMQSLFEFDKEMEKAIREMEAGTEVVSDIMEQTETTAENADNYGKNYIMIFYFADLKEYQKAQDFLKITDKTNPSGVLTAVLKKAGMK